jgi:hypothetical protein
MELMDLTPRMQRNDGPINLPVLEPRAALCAPGYAGHVCFAVFEEVGDCGRGGGNKFDVLGLHFVEEADCVFCCVFDYDEEGPVAYGGVGAHEHCLR